MCEVVPRQRLEMQEWEETGLSLCATLSTHATRRYPIETTAGGLDFRTSFQRDRDRILHSRAFRRLKHKTQVYVPHTGDHPRTRLTHTLEVAQLSRTLARALALNEDLVEAIALAHDLGHTPFGHSGEKVLAQILAGEEPSCPLPESLRAACGSFKHNYQSVRVVDLLEHRYDHPGLNLTDQVREGVLKHTSWKTTFPFPLPTSEGLRLGLPCHLEGQVVALADEIAQQTHDLEDGLHAGAVSVAEVEALALPRAVLNRAGAAGTNQGGQWRRIATLQRGLIDLLVTDAVHTTARRINRQLRKYHLDTRERWRQAADRISASTVALSNPVADMLAELKAFIYRFIINHQEVNRQDHRARLVITGLFRAYHTNPLTLPTYALLRFAQGSGRPFLRDLPIARVKVEVLQHYLANPQFIRIIVDHLAGMSDRFALEEYRALYHPGENFSGGAGGGV